jgi:fimbrial chaperone protein
MAAASRVRSCTAFLRTSKAPAIGAGLFLGFALGQAGALSAAAFRVTPIQVALSSTNSSALLTLTNESSETLRFQVTAHAWTQGRKGEIELAPTQDIVFFPALLTLEAGKERKIRVGTSASAGPVEKTYRIFVEELPPVEQPKESAAPRSEVRVRTKMGIPIFLQPAAKAQMAGAIESPALEGGQVRFRVRNTGNVHFTLLSVRITGTSASGETIFENQAEGWYVLSGGIREYEIPVPPADCARVKFFAVEAANEHETMKARLDAPPGACAPASH